MLRLAVVPALVLAAGAAAAQVVTHDLKVQALMATGVNPAALAFWAGGNDPPEDETPAAAEVRWTAALKGAEDLQAHGRALTGVSRPGRWTGDAQLMIDTAEEGAAAARARDAEKAFEIGGRLYDSCNGCHKAYIPTPPRAPCTVAGRAPTEALPALPDCDRGACYPEGASGRGFSSPLRPAQARNSSGQAWAGLPRAR